MKKHKELFEKIKKHYDPDNFEEGNDKPLKRKLMWLKSNKWRKNCKERGYDNIKACDIVILGCNAPSGDYRTYWDIIQDFFDNRPWIWCENLIDYTTGMNLPKGKDGVNELLKYIEECDCELGGYVNFTMEEIEGEKRN